MNEIAYQSPLTADRSRDTPAQRSKFARVKRAQIMYERKLRKVARTVGHVVEGMAGDDPVGNAAAIQSALRQYAGVVRQWAQRAAASMLADVLRRDESAWAQVSKEMSRNLREEIRSAPTGEVVRDLMEQQVELITSLPLEAATRVHALVFKSMETGGRASEIASEIMRSGEVSESRATTIARTETSRASSNLVQARSLHVGSEGYIWTAVMDVDTRLLHRQLNGKFVRWDSPPVAGSNGERAHAGTIYNCRCFPIPVIPDNVI